MPRRPAAWGRSPEQLLKPEALQRAANRCDRGNFTGARAIALHARKPSLTPYLQSQRSACERSRAHVGEHYATRPHRRGYRRHVHGPADLRRAYALARQPQDADDAGRSLARPADGHQGGCGQGRLHACRRGLPAARHDHRDQRRSRTQARPRRPRHDRALRGRG